MPLTNLQEKQIRQAGSRHGRRKTGLFLVEGVRCCREGLSRRPDCCELAVCSESFQHSGDFAWLAEVERQTGKTVCVISDRELAKLAATENPQGVLCLFHRPPPVPETRPGDPFVLVLDRVSEPGNMGTILRTAWAIGLHEVWLTEGAADPYSPKVIRAGMGAQFGLNLRFYPDLEKVAHALTSLGIERIWLSMPDGKTGCYAPEFDLRNSALVIGNEAEGVTQVAGAESVSIPMPGNAESLNVAQAATVLLFEAVRRGLLTG
jgi:TrmH family RNA methyltransferase